MPVKKDQLPSPGALIKLTKGNYAARIDAIKEITNIFWLERIIYIVIITCSLVIMLIAAGMSLYKGDFSGSRGLVTGGSGGICTAAISGLLYMWNRALNLAFNIDKEGKSK